VFKIIDVYSMFATFTSDGLNKFSFLFCRCSFYRVYQPIWKVCQSETTWSRVNRTWSYRFWGK